VSDQESFISHLIELRERLMKAVGAVLVLFIALAMCVVLFFVFGSVVLPLKAIAMNMLSLTASFGAIV